MDNQAQRDREKLTQASAKISQENRKMLEHIDELMRRGQMLEARIVSSNQKMHNTEPHHYVLDIVNRILGMKYYRLLQPSGKDSMRAYYCLTEK